MNSDLYTERNKWLAADNKVILNDCRVDYYQASGPGGQKRNKKMSGVRLSHLPTSLSVTAVDSRSQNDNKVIAVNKLKVVIALNIRGEDIDFSQMDVNIKNPKYPLFVARIFDLLHSFNFDISLTAEKLDISKSKFIKILKKDDRLLTEFNKNREKLNLFKI